MCGKIVKRLYYFPKKDCIIFFKKVDKVAILMLFYKKNSLIKKDCQEKIIIPSFPSNMVSAITKFHRFASEFHRRGCIIFPKDCIIEIAFFPKDCNIEIVINFIFPVRKTPLTVKVALYIIRS